MASLRALSDATPNTSVSRRVFSNVVFSNFLMSDGDIVSVSAVKLIAS